MKVYSRPGCGGCEAVKRILTEKEIDFEISDDFAYLIEKGLSQLPVIETEENKFFAGSAAIKYAKDL